MFPAEEDELMEIANTIERIMINIFHCDFMDNRDLLFRLILPSCEIIIDESDGWKMSSMDENRFFVEAAHAMTDTEFIGRCLQTGMKAVLGVAQVSNLLDCVFWGYLSRSSDHRLILFYYLFLLFFFFVK